MKPVSVVIPAHNEAAIIERLLTQLVGHRGADELRVVVVANGCTDDTAARAAALGGCVRVIETEVPSKSNALNLGDAAASGFPRFYVDADVVLDLDAVRQVAAALQQPGVLAAAPLMRVDCAQRSWAVRAYYAVWLQLPYCRQGMIGSGVYAVSEEGRKRWDTFPDITADDAFVRLHFAPHERKTVETCTFTITPPTTLRGIIDIKTRSHFGNEELKRRFPELWRNEEANHQGGLLGLAINPGWWPALAVYLYAKLATRRRVRQRFKHGQMKLWERDESSRESVVAPHP